MNPFRFHIVDGERISNKASQPFYMICDAKQGERGREPRT